MPVTRVGNFRPPFFLFLGFATFLALQAQYVVLWRTYYSHSPARGYERAMAAGQVAPSFSATRHTLVVGEIVLFLLPLMSLALGRTVARKLSASATLWAGVMIGLVAVWISVPRLRNDSNMWPIDLVFLAFATGLPMCAGTLVHLALAEFVFYDRNPRDPSDRGT